MQSAIMAHINLLPMCSCSTAVDVVLMQCHNSLKPRLSAPDFFSQLWRKIVTESQGLRLVILDTVICLYKQ